MAGVLVAVGLLRTTPTYPVNVNYASAPGLFTGAAVDVLGVKVGTVTQVRNVGDKVHVVLAVDQGTKIPAAAFASLVAPQLLGSPDVDLNPGYTGGPALSPGATIPEDHTAVPVSTDEVLKELQKTLNALNPHAVGDLVTNLATDLDGQGANLNKLIASAAGTVQLLAEKGNDLGQLNGTLAQLTGTLDSDTANIESLVQQYDTVSTTVAQHSGQLNDAITQLAGASTGLVNLLVSQPPAARGRRGHGHDGGTHPRPQPVERRRDPGQRQQPLPGRRAGLRPELQLAQPEPPDEPGREQRLHRRAHPRPAGRRLPAHHGQPLLGAVLVGAGLARPVRQPLVGLLRPPHRRHPVRPRFAHRPGRLHHRAVAHGHGPPADRRCARQRRQRQHHERRVHAGHPRTVVHEHHAVRSRRPRRPRSRRRPPRPPHPCGLLNAILGCTPQSGTNGGTGSGGGLLSDEVNQAATAQQPTATLAADAATPHSGPTLTAPAASLLGPLPQTRGQRHGAGAAQRGPVDQWWHDVEGWF